MCVSYKKFNIFFMMNVQNKYESIVFCSMIIQFFVHAIRTFNGYNIQIFKKINVQN